MKFRELILIVCIFLFPIKELTGQGFYKDIFMDGGVKVTSRKRLPAADYLDLSIEYFASSRYTSTFPPVRRDSVLQNKLYIGSDEDLNGILLYPDGQPRFRVLYVNGGKATSHGRSLGKKGRERMKTFFTKGGSYVGSCAGAYLVASATIKADTVFPREYYLHTWPGVARATGLSHSYTGMNVEENSPLLRFSDFGGDYFIDSVRHNGGCFAWTEQLYPPETEVLLRYNYKDRIKGRSIDNEISAWAYKPSEKSGRIVVIGSHPESVTSGERLDLMASLISYGLDGVAGPGIKGGLQNGKKRKMYKSTFENDPDYTMIGDKQYHHFTVTIPPGAKDIFLELNGAQDYDLFLYMNRNDFAFKKTSTHKDIAKGADKRMHFDTLEPGLWYIAVECNTTVKTEITDSGVKYTGNTSVLNGVPYSLLISWK